MERGLRYLTILNLISTLRYLCYWESPCGIFLYILLSDVLKIAKWTLRRTFFCAVGLS